MQFLLPELDKTKSHTVSHTTHSQSSLWATSCEQILQFMAVAQKHWCSVWNPCWLTLAKKEMNKTTGRLAWLRKLAMNEYLLSGSKFNSEHLLCSNLKHLCRNRLSSRNRLLTISITLLREKTQLYLCITLIIKFPLISSKTINPHFNIMHLLVIVATMCGFF